MTKVQDYRAVARWYLKVLMVAMIILSVLLRMNAFSHTVGLVLNWIMVSLTGLFLFKNPLLMSDAEVRFIFKCTE